MTVNGNDYTTTVQNDGTWSVDVATSDLIADNSVDVSVASSDAAGNSVTSTASTSVSVDTVPGNLPNGEPMAAPQVSIVDDTNNDGTINANEKDSEVNFEISMPEGVEAGDTLNVDVNGTVTSVEITQNMIDAGKYEGVTTTPDEGQSVVITASITDKQGNTTESSSDSAQVDTVFGDGEILGKLAITDITDNNGDYSSVTMHGTGAIPGDTIKLFYNGGTNASDGEFDDTQEPATVNSQVVTTTVNDDGTWSIDISNLDKTPVNDNEFFSVVEYDKDGNTIATATTHYYHGTYNPAGLESEDDFVLTGAGNDTIIANVNDTNDYVMIDGGNGQDIVEFAGSINDYNIVRQDADTVIVTKKGTGSDSENDNDNIGDVYELRNVENLKFGGTIYNVTESGEINAAPIAHDETKVEVPVTIIRNGEDIENLGNIGDNHRNSHNVQADTKTETFSFGKEHAGEEVVLTFDSHVTGGWEDGTGPGNETRDAFIISANGQELANLSYDEDDDNDNTWNNTHSYKITLDENGDAHVAFTVASTAKNEVVDISNIKVSLSTTELQGITTDEDHSVIIDILSNDTDADNDRLSIIKIDGQDVTNGAVATIKDSDDNVLGTARVTSDGKIEFTPDTSLQSLNDGDNKEISFEYSVSDGRGGEDSANISLNILGVDEGVTLNYHNVGDASTRYGGEGYVDHAGKEVITGNGDDVINIADDIEHGATIMTQAGNDTINVGDDFDQGELYTGEGDDTVNIHDDLGDKHHHNQAGHIFTGDGNDVISVEGTVRNASSIDSGAGDDTIKLKDISSSFDNGSVKLGEGDDTLILNDNLDGSNSTFDGGAGNDMLVLNAESINLDNIKNIEEITLGDDTQEITISAKDVLEITDSNNTLVIHGDENDTVHLKDDQSCGMQNDKWEKLDDFVQINGENYVQYSDGSATLLIQNNIIVDES